MLNYTQIVWARQVGWKSLIVLPNALAWAGVVSWSFLELVWNKLSGSKDLKAVQKLELSLCESLWIWAGPRLKKQFVKVVEQIYVVASGILFLSTAVPFLLVERQRDRQGKENNEVVKLAEF